MEGGADSQGIVSTGAVSSAAEAEPEECMEEAVSTHRQQHVLHVSIHIRHATPMRLDMQHATVCESHHSGQLAFIGSSFDHGADCLADLQVHHVYGWYVLALLRFSKHKTACKHGCVVIFSAYCSGKLSALAVGPSSDWLSSWCWMCWIRSGRCGMGLPLP